MKYLPNIITLSRIALSIGLLMIKPFSLLFFIVYLACGLSDFLDGFIARKMSVASDFGARMDSVADLVFVIVMFVILLPIVKIPHYILLWIVLIAVIRIISMMIVLFKYHTFAVLHTYANKATGLVILCLPLLLSIVDLNILACIVCTLASISAMEEMIIHISSKKLDINISGILTK